MLAAARPVAVDFWAPWCGPCHAVTQALEELAGETDGIEFVKLDIDANPVDGGALRRALDPDGDPLRRRSGRARA